METPLTPLEFARRARRLYAGREAVVDGQRRFTYEAFFARCDRWASGLQRLGVARGDRVAYIATNTTRQLESFYAVPSIGAVLVPDQLPADRRRLLLHHQPQRRDRRLRRSGVRAGRRRHSRTNYTTVRHYVTLDERAAGPGWHRVRRVARRRLGPASTPPEIAERDLLTINYTSGTTSRPKGVMITHRNAYMNTVGTLVHIPMTCADRYLWTLPMFHANGWTFTWTVTAAGGVHVCLPKIDPRARLRARSATSASRSSARLPRSSSASRMRPRTRGRASRGVCE